MSVRNHGRLFIVEGDGWHWGLINGRVIGGAARREGGCRGGGTINTIRSAIRQMQLKGIPGKYCGW